MRKKYLSALLFGALLVTSAGTFTSCKDYDDDINNLQEQIDVIKTDLASLTETVNNLDGVKDMSFTDGKLVIETGKGKKVEVDIPAASSIVKVELKDNVLYVNDEPKGEVVIPEDKDVKVEVKEDGKLYINDEVQDLEIGSKVVMVDNGAYYTMTIDGKESYNLPKYSAAATIESITILNDDFGAEVTSPALAINKYTFIQDNKNTWKNLTGKTITDKKFILASATEFPVRVNPVSAQLTNVNFYLTNSKNETMPNVVLKATEYKEYATRADYGNGLYTLAMNKVAVNADGVPADKKLGDILYALNADNAFRADYNITASVTGATVGLGYDYNVGDYSVSKGNQTTKSNTSGEVISATNDQSELTEKIDAKKSYKITTVVSDANFDANIYDMWLSVSDPDKNLFDIQFDQDNHSFSVNADPDIISKADFVLTVHTLTNEGKYVKQPIKITVSNKLVADADYAKIDHTIKKNTLTSGKETKNFFKAEMSTMLNSLGDQLNVWKRKVNKATIAGFYTDKECTSPVKNATGISLSLLKADNSEVLADNNANIISAANMKFTVDNSVAPTYFQVDKVYYVKVSFSEGSEELNSIVIPFEFNIPTLASEFEIKSGYVVDDVINAYFYKTDTSVDFAKYFAKTPAEDTNLTYELSGHKNAAEQELLYLPNGKNAEFVATTGQANINLEGNYTNKVPEGYGKTVTVKVTKTDYYGWEYKAEGSGTYSFKIKLLSPIYEGTVVPVEDQTITIKANDLVKGALITDKMITGKDYAGNTYNVVPDTTEGDAPSITADEKGDVTVSTDAKWANPQISYAIPQFDELEYIKTLEVLPATPKQGDTPASNGAYKLTGESISQTVTVDLPVKVKDAWGYIKTQTVKVTIEK